MSAFVSGARDPDELYGDQERATADVEGLRRFLEGRGDALVREPGKRSWPTAR